jgi:hypothetical protein
LFNAIETRLRLTISDGLAAATEEPGPGTVGHVLSSLLECVFALEQLQLMLAVERGRRPPSSGPTAPCSRQRLGASHDDQAGRPGLAFDGEQTRRAVPPTLRLIDTPLKVSS